MNDKFAAGRSALWHIALGASIAVSACAARRGEVVSVPPAPTDVAPPASPNDQCLVVPFPETPRDTAIVSVEVKYRPWYSSSAAAPSTGVARASDFVIAQLYETMVRVTCDGRVIPELAERSRSDSNGRVMNFTLRAGARFSDGAPVTTDDVQDSWGARVGSISLFLRDTSQQSSATRNIGVLMFSQHAASINAFAQLSRAVARKGSAREWPIGGGRFVIDSAASDATPGVTVLHPATSRPGLATPTIIFREDSTRDQRDIIDQGIDILQTRDATVIDYARRGPFRIHPLPFDRTYTLAIPPSTTADSAVAESRMSASDAAQFRSALARDAVRVEARAPEADAWWFGLSCPEFSTAGTARGNAAAQGRLAQVMYDARDPVARALAERVVAISRAARSGANPADVDARTISQLLPALRAMTASGMTLTAAPATSASLRAGSAVAFVLALPSRTLSGCESFLRSRQDADWLMPASLFPLVETRSTLITRAGAPAVLIDWDGTLRIQPSPAVRR